jgi:hypothetical protein
MQVFVHSPGTGKAVAYNVTPETTINELAKKITDKEGIPFPNSGYNIRHAGRFLLAHGDKTLKNLKIGKNSTFYLTSKKNMSGGKRKTRANRKNRKNMTRRRR